MDNRATGPDIPESSPSIIIDDIQISFPCDSQSEIILTLNNVKQTLQVDFLAKDFPLNLDSALKGLDLYSLDIQAILNLFQVKVVDFLLVNAMKSGMQGINRLSAQELHERNGSSAVSALGERGNSLMSQIESDFARILSLNSSFLIEVFERGQLIEKAKEELLDNLHRKYILVVNQLSELNKGNSIVEPPLVTQIKDLIDNL